MLRRLVVLDDVYLCICHDFIRGQELAVGDPEVPSWYWSIAVYPSRAIGRGRQLITKLIVLGLGGIISHIEVGRLATWSLISRNLAEVDCVDGLFGCKINHQVIWSSLIGGEVVILFVLEASITGDSRGTRWDYSVNYIGGRATDYIRGRCRRDYNLLVSKVIRCKHAWDDSSCNEYFHHFYYL